MESVRPKIFASDRLDILWLLMPVFLLAIVIFIYPMVYLVLVSFHKTSYLKILEFTGFDNYRKVMSDSQIIHSLIVSLKFIAGTLLVSVPLGLGLAVVLDGPIRFRTVFMTFLLFPYVVSQMTAAILWRWFLEPMYGPLNALLSKVGISSIQFLGNPDLALVAMILINAWMCFPFAMVLLHAAIITIPKDLYEAAYLDGATRWGCFLNVTLPLIMNTLMVVMIVLTVQTFNMVTLIYGLTAGGPVDVTTTMSFKIFYEAFFNFRLAMACVMGIVMFVANILFAIAYVATLRREALY